MRGALIGLKEQGQTGMSVSDFHVDSSRSTLHFRCSLHRAPLSTCPPALQHELSSILYPVFVHTYLHLISLGAAAEASALIASHKQRFIDAAGGSKSRVQVGRCGEGGQWH